MLSYLLKIFNLSLKDAKMTLTLVRKDFSEDGIYGELHDDKGKLSLVTLEHSYNKKPKLSDGTYTCSRGIHRLHNMIPFDTFEIEGVKGHDDILFHIGNYNKDSEGCVLVGIDRGDKMIKHSAIAFSKLMAHLEKLQNFTLIVKSV